MKNKNETRYIYRGTFQTRDILITVANRAKLFSFHASV